ncbi:nuclease-related domain-containing protein [Arthrobacter sp. MDB2-24]
MEAGQGAAEQAQRIGERVSRLEGEIERLEVELEQARKAQQAWLAGAEGEARVGEQLLQLELQGWRMLHDVHWPGRPKANLDHIAVGPGGVLVIDAKNWSGDVRMRDSELYQNGYIRKRETVSALEQCAAVAALLEPQHRSTAQAWICLVGQPDLVGATNVGVTVVGIDALVDAVRALPSVLEDEFVRAIHEYLKGLLAGPVSPAAATTALLDRPQGESSLLIARRAAAAYSASDGRPRAAPRMPAATPSNRRRRKNEPSCLGAMWRLVLLALVLWIGAGALQHVVVSSSTPPVQPSPSPSIVHPDLPG